MDDDLSFLLALASENENAAAGGDADDDDLPVLDFASNQLSLGRAAPSERLSRMMAELEAPDDDDSDNADDDNNAANPRFSEIHFPDFDQDDDSADDELGDVREPAPFRPPSSPSVSDDDQVAFPAAPPDMASTAVDAAVINTDDTKRPAVNEQADDGAFVELPDDIDESVPVEPVPTPTDTIPASPASVASSLSLASPASPPTSPKKAKPTGVSAAARGADDGRPELCVECESRKPKAKVKRKGFLLWLCKTCAREKNSQFEQMGTINIAAIADWKKTPLSPRSAEALAKKEAENGNKAVVSPPSTQSPPQSPQLAARTEQPSVATAVPKSPTTTIPKSPATTVPKSPQLSKSPSSKRKKQCNVCAKPAECKSTAKNGQVLYFCGACLKAARDGTLLVQQRQREEERQRLDQLQRLNEQTEQARAVAKSPPTSPRLAAMRKPTQRRNSSPNKMVPLSPKQRRAATTQLSTEEKPAPASPARQQPSSQATPPASPAKGVPLNAGGNCVRCNKRKGQVKAGVGGGQIVVLCVPCAKQLRKRRASMLKAQKKRKGSQAPPPAAAAAKSPFVELPKRRPPRCEDCQRNKVKAIIKKDGETLYLCKRCTLRHKKNFETAEQLALRAKLPPERPQSPPVPPEPELAEPTSPREPPSLPRNSVIGVKPVADLPARGNAVVAAPLTVDDVSLDAQSLSSSTDSVPPPAPDDSTSNDAAAAAAANNNTTPVVGESDTFHGRGASASDDEDTLDDTVMLGLRSRPDDDDDDDSIVGAQEIGDKTIRETASQALRETGVDDGEVDEMLMSILSSGALGKSADDLVRTIDEDQPQSVQKSKSMPVISKNAGRKPGSGEICEVCEKRVYVTERVAVDGLVFHKPCLRCAECKSVLSPSTYASLNGKFYCKPHFKQLFKVKGNYDDGFGTQPHKKKWTESVSMSSSGTQFAGVSLSDSKK